MTTVELAAKVAVEPVAEPAIEPVVETAAVAAAVMVAEQAASPCTTTEKSLLSKHLRQYEELMKVQPQRHTESQLLRERQHQRRLQETRQREELETAQAQSGARCCHLATNCSTSITV